MSTFTTAKNGLVRATAIVSVKIKLEDLLKGNAEISIGDVFYTEDNIKFMCMEDVKLTQFNSIYEVKTICMSPGSIGNVPAHTITKFNRNYYDSCTNNHAAHGGVD